MEFFFLFFLFSFSVCAVCFGGSFVLLPGLAYTVSAEIHGLFFILDSSGR